MFESSALSLVIAIKVLLVLPLGMVGTQHLPLPLPEYQGLVDGAGRCMHVSPGKHFL